MKLEMRDESIVQMMGLHITREADMASRSATNVVIYSLPSGQSLHPKCNAAPIRFSSFQVRPWCGLAAGLKRIQRFSFHGIGGRFPWDSRKMNHGVITTNVSVLLNGTDYEFREDGAELEVRVPLPSVEEAGRQLTARYVAVDAQATSLIVRVETVLGVKILLNASTLYANVIPSETVWFVDETEVVLSLKKVDDELSWPDLVQDWVSLAKGVRSLLKGASVYVVGDISDVNWAVAQDLATGLQYVPLQTQQLIEKLKKTSVTELVLEKGEDSVAEAEEAVLTSLGQHMRCVVATLGGRQGAASRLDGWKGLHAGFSIWLSQSQAQDEKSAKEEVVKAKRVGTQAYVKADVVVALSGWDSTAVRPTAEGALRALKSLLEREKNLPGKKSLYVRLGCRGDWPDIMQPGWNPASPQDEEKKAQSLAV